MVEGDSGEKSARLSDQEVKLLNAIANIMIPTSSQGDLPGGGEVDFHTYLYNENLIDWAREGLEYFSIESQAISALERFTDLPSADQVYVMACLQRGLRNFLSPLTKYLIQCYYLDDRVMRAIGLEYRPPFPYGYNVEEGDLSLLEPVFLRGRIYR
jgi:hypothetical protein